MYIKVKDRILYKELENYLFTLKNWNKFIAKIKVNHNFIIKDNYYYCTHCKAQFKANTKINNTMRCPNCYLNLYVKSKRLKHYKFSDYLSILDKYKDYYVQRIYMLESIYNNRKIDSSCYEFGRIIYDSSFNVMHEIINDNVVATISGNWISHRKDSEYNWRHSSSYYCPLSYIHDFIYYPYNLKKILPEKYKYSRLWTLVSKVGYCDLIYLLKNYNYSVELLIKSGLYNLALCPKSFNSKKSFEERFYGLSKDYLPYIKKHNLNIDELKALSIVKKKDIRLIKNIVLIPGFEKLSVDGVNFVKAFKLTDLCVLNSHEYIDYLKFARELGFDLKDKNILYPKKIKIAHDNLLKQIEINKNKRIDAKIVKIARKISSTQYKSKKYIIFPADSYKSLVDESKQQNNCVRTYAEKVAAGECYIYFMRELTNINHSLVTVEVRNKKVVQKRTKNNEITSKEQDKFLKEWELTILRKCEVMN